MDWIISYRIPKVNLSNDVSQQNALLTTKLYVPPVRPELVSRPRLIERLNAGLHCKLTLISAPAGFGKATLLSEWVYEVGGHALHLDPVGLGLTITSIALDDTLAPGIDRRLRPVS